MAEVCDRHGVSRPTGYKWIARYAEGGRHSLGDRSRAPHTCPHKLSTSMTELLCTRLLLPIDDGGSRVALLAHLSRVALDEMRRGEAGVPVLLGVSCVKNR